MSSPVGGCQCAPGDRGSRKGSHASGSAWRRRLGGRGLACRQEQAVVVDLGRQGGHVPVIRLLVGQTVNVRTYSSVICLYMCCARLLNLC